MSAELDAALRLIKALEQENLELVGIVRLILIEWEKPTEGVLPGELIARLSQYSKEAREVLRKYDRKKEIEALWRLQGSRKENTNGACEKHHS